MILKCKDCYNCDKPIKTCCIRDEILDIEIDRDCDTSIISKPGVRWEKGIEHHEKSQELARAIGDIDVNNGDYFCFKFGGDGDNGEELMYLLDTYFEAQEKGL